MFATYTVFSIILFVFLCFVWRSDDGINLLRAPHRGSPVAIFILSKDDPLQKQILNGDKIY